MAGIWIVLECEVISEEKIQFLGVVLAVKLFQGLTTGFLMSKQDAKVRRRILHADHTAELPVQHWGMWRPSPGILLKRLIDCLIHS